MPKRRTFGARCARCIDDIIATSTVVFCFGEHTYALELCERHAAMWEQDMLAWVRVAHEAEPHAAPAKPEWVPGARFAPKVQLPERAPVVVRLEPDVTPWQANGRPVADPRLPENSETWVFTDHAKMRMAQREVTATDALWAAANPAVVKPGREPELTVHDRDGIRAVVNVKRNVIVTVSRPDMEGK